MAVSVDNVSFPAAVVKDVSFRVDYRAKNSGPTVVSPTISLYINGVLKKSMVVGPLNVNATEAAYFEVSHNAAGTFTLEIKEGSTVLFTGTVVVTNTSGFSLANVVVPGTVDAGEEFEITGDLTYANATIVPTFAELYVDGLLYQTANCGPMGGDFGSFMALRYPVMNTFPGTHTVAIEVGGVELYSGSFTVVPVPGVTAVSTSRAAFDTDAHRKTKIIPQEIVITVPPQGVFGRVGQSDADFFEQKFVYDLMQEETLDHPVEVTDRPAINIVEAQSNRLMARTLSFKVKLAAGVFAIDTTRHGAGEFVYYQDDRSTDGLPDEHVLAQQIARIKSLRNKHVFVYTVLEPSFEGIVQDINLVKDNKSRTTVGAQITVRELLRGSKSKVRFEFARFDPALGETGFIASENVETFRVQARTAAEAPSPREPGRLGGYPSIAVQPRFLLQREAIGGLRIVGGLVGSQADNPNAIRLVNALPDEFSGGSGSLIRSNDDTAATLSGSLQVGYGALSFATKWDSRPIGAYVIDFPDMPSRITDFTLVFEVAGVPVRAQFAHGRDNFRVKVETGNIVARSGSQVNQVERISEFTTPSDASPFVPIVAQCGSIDSSPYLRNMLKSVAEPFSVDFVFWVQPRGSFRAVPRLQEGRRTRTLATPDDPRSHEIESSSPFGVDRLAPPPPGEMKHYFLVCVPVLHLGA